MAQRPLRIRTSLRVQRSLLVRRWLQGLVRTSGRPYWDDYPYYGYDDYNDGDYEQTVVAVQQELEKLGYYHGQIDGIVGPETRKAISWFQSVDKLSVSGRIDDATLKALQIS